MAFKTSSAVPNISPLGLLNSTFHGNDLYPDPRTLFELFTAYEESCDDDSFLGEGENEEFLPRRSLLLAALLLIEDVLLFKANSDVHPSNFFALPNFSQHAILNTNNCLAGSYSR
jgi:hypothetical protein